MSAAAARLRLVLGFDLRRHLRRPLLIFLVLLLGWIAHGLSTGDMMIVTSGDSRIGGTKAWLTSEFALSQLFAAMATFYAYFVAIAAGMAMIREDELKVGELLHATPLRPAEYVWGKFLAILAAFLAVAAVHLALLVYFFHGPSPAEPEIVGPFALGSYLRPVAVFLLPCLVFLAGTSFAVGHWTRRPILVFLFPVVLLSALFFFLWNWSPSWLDPRANRLLMLLDPTGFRWIRETWLLVDRGVEFYNTAPVRYDALFLASRLGVIGLGLGAVVSVQRGTGPGARDRGAKRPGWLSRLRGGAAAAEQKSEPAAPAAPHVPAPVPAAVGGGGRNLGWWGGTLAVARVELRELRSSPALYLFVPLILLQTLANALLATGAFEAPILLTSGFLASFEVNFFTFLLCPLLLFYAVESMERERSTGVAEIYYSTPLATLSVVLGKVLGLAAVAVAILTAALAANAVLLLAQGEAPFAVLPFAVVWGGILAPTFLLWVAFIVAVWSVSGNRYVTYGAALGAFGFTLYQQFTGELTWLGNWLVWSAVQWSDLAALELHRTMLLANRGLALTLAALLVAVAVRALGRRQADVYRRVDRLRPRPLAREALRLAPWAALPALFAGLLWAGVDRGAEGERAEQRRKDYWRSNVATWADREVPSLAAVDLDVELVPEESRLRVEGTYELVNDLGEPRRQIPITAGFHWRQLRWTLDGEAFEPEDRAGLHVFELPEPLPPGGTVEIGFAYEGRFPDGASKNGGPTWEAILPSAVVLTSFGNELGSHGPSFVPIVGYVDSIGVDEDNEHDERVYPEGFHHGRVRPFVGGRRAFDVRMRITGPPELTYNGVGVKLSDEVADGRRTTVWQSDHPVRFFNIVAGRWDVHQGETAAIYHHPGHTYNLDEILLALEGSRRWYSEWFAPYPWTELKLSEFPRIHSYAMGMPTNIPFSESLGFLTRDDPDANAPFMVTAHEAAHQWWGNILVPGDGPGGAVLSEGMAHYSTLMLFEQLKGERHRMAFARQIEDRYGNRRRVDSEQPLVRFDYSRAGDQTVVYDKGGWTMWMLMRHLGRDAMLAGLQRFIETYREGGDYPLLEDLLAALRPFAEDVPAFDAFVDQWFRDVVVPRYRLRDAHREPAGGSWRVRAEVANLGTGTMPVEIAAARGERFDEEGAASPGYRDERVTVVLGPGESRTVEIRAGFEPERLVVDPDVQVLQLHRGDAVARF